MAPRGRKPKPTAQKRAAGTLRKDRTPRSEPKFAPVAKGTEAEHVLDVHAAQLRAAGVMQSPDGPALEMMKSMYDIAIKARDHLRTHPLTRVDENGIERKSPWLQILRDNATQFRAYAVEFGMTPSARQRVAGVPDPEDDLNDIALGKGRKRG